MTNPSVKFIRLAAIFGATAVAIGAFGAHGLKPHLSEYQLDIFEKGVHYQFFHTLALLGVGILAGQRPGQKNLARAGWLFALGILFFSGSLYLLACTDILPFSVRWAGPVTPIGGLCFLAGWGLLAWSAFSEKK